MPSSHRSRRRAEFDELASTFDDCEFDEQAESPDESLESFIVEVSAAHPNGALPATPATWRSIFRSRSRPASTLRVDSAEVVGKPARQVLQNLATRNAEDPQELRSSRELDHKPHRTRPASSEMRLRTSVRR